MIFEDIYSYCTSKAHSEVTYPFDECTIAMKVLGKIFALIPTEKQGTINLKHHSDKIPNLLERFDAIKPGYHMNKQHWITVDFTDKSLSYSFIISLIDTSYALIVTSMSKKLQTKLNTVFTCIPYGSAEYFGALSLRNEILRKPLGLIINENDIDNEDIDIHIIACDGEQIIGCLLLKDQGNGIVKMRQVAILKKFQGIGIGTDLIKYAEHIAIEHGYHTIELHARLSSAIFYDNLLYSRVGDEFLEVTIPHVQMTKHL